MLLRVLRQGSPKPIGGRDRNPKHPCGQPPIQSRAGAAMQAQAAARALQPAPALPGARRGPRQRRAAPVRATGQGNEGDSQDAPAGGAPPQAPLDVPPPAALGSAVAGEANKGAKGAGSVWESLKVRSCSHHCGGLCQSCPCRTCAAAPCSPGPALARSLAAPQARPALAAAAAGAAAARCAPVPIPVRALPSSLLHSMRSARSSSAGTAGRSPLHSRLLTLRCACCHVLRRSGAPRWRAASPRRAPSLSGSWRR